MKHPTNPISFWSLWWNAIDRWSFVAVLMLMGMGLWLIMAASPSVALQHNWSPFLLLKRHLIILGPSLLILIATSFCQKSILVFSSIAVAIIAWLGVWGVLAFGPEIKGAKRWLSIAGFSLQPSEFLKPALIIIVADLLSRGKGFLWAGAILVVSVFPLFLQPDLGMIFLISVVWFGQCFIGGLGWIWTAGACCGSVVGALGIYLCFPHAAHRIHIFFSGASQDPFGSQYQIIQALKSFSSGGLLGRGPGAGTVLNTLPDGHADFIFAVAGEEWGLLVCLLILGLYALIVFRCLSHVFRETEPFYILGVAGLTLQLSFQTILNVASVLRLIPTKGVTLPFMSYGGSSFLSLCWAMGMILALTRRYRERLW